MVHEKLVWSVDMRAEPVTITRLSTHLATTAPLIVMFGPPTCLRVPTKTELETGMSSKVVRDRPADVTVIFRSNSKGKQY